jgi:hypothetical protein
MAASVSQLINPLPVSLRLEEVILPEPEILHRYAIRIPETGTFISAAGEIKQVEIKGSWLDTLGAKTVAEASSPFEILWVDEQLRLDELRTIYHSLEHKPDLAVALNADAEVSGLFCLPAFKVK